MVDGADLLPTSENFFKNKENFAISVISHCNFLIGKIPKGYAFQLFSKSPASVPDTPKIMSNPVHFCSWSNLHKRVPIAFNRNVRADYQGIFGSPNKGEESPLPPLLRTVRDTFASYGSSISQPGYRAAIGKERQFGLRFRRQDS